LSEPTRYAAFLSYSHRDKRWADWLHRALETYRPPARLGGGAAQRAEMREALRPIFRDRDELPASPDLSQQIDEALNASRALIVLCSPAAAKSQWTNAEIARFKRLHPDRPVLAVLVAGEPYASEMAGREDEEAFPPALRFQVAPDGSLTDIRAEPIAADVRPDADGKRMGKLKVVAGLLGVGLDRLVQRETARRNRRFAYVAGASLAGMALTSGLALYAFRQRAEAVRQREQADGLIEFMLTDLRRKLEPLGRLDVMDTVGERALHYYASQDLADLDADALGRRARALQMVGEVANQRGNLDGALPLFEQASATTAEQLRRDPNNPQRIFDHAQSVYWVGYVAWQRGDLTTARRYFTQYRDFAQRLSSVAADKPAWQAEEGYADINLGVVDLDGGRPDRALAGFEAGREVWARLSARYRDHPDFGYWLGQTLGRKADARSRLGDYPGALDERRQELAVYKAILAQDPGNSQAMSGIGVVWQRSAQIQLDAGKPAEAVTLADQSLQVIRLLEAKDPTNSMWKEMAVKAADTRVDGLMMIGEWQAAHAENAQALSDARELVATDRTIANWRTQCLMHARWTEIVIDHRLGSGSALRGKIEDFARDFPEAASVKDNDERFARMIVLVVSALDHRAHGDAVQADADVAHAVRLVPPAGAILEPRITAMTRVLYKLAPSASLRPQVSADNSGKYQLGAVLFTRSGGQ
jgi:tetratricopeptide (TPR) repeat protein